MFRAESETWENTIFVLPTKRKTNNIMKYFDIIRITKTAKIN